MRYYLESPGTYLLLHSRGALPSARRGLTSVFGMRTGDHPRYRHQDPRDKVGS